VVVSAHETSIIAVIESVEKTKMDFFITSIAPLIASASEIESSIEGSNSLGLFGGRAAMRTNMNCAE
jgi:hypothetical protein